MQVAQRDLEYAEAIAARFPEGSALGTARDRAEEGHAVAVAAIGASMSPGDGAGKVYQPCRLTRACIVAL